VYPFPIEGIIFQLAVSNYPSYRNIGVISGDADYISGQCVTIDGETCAEHAWVYGSGNNDSAEGGTTLFNHYPQHPESYSFLQQLLFDVWPKRLG
jgi:hypothetical protein